MDNLANDLSPKGIIRAMRGLALAALHRAAPVGTSTSRALPASRSRFFE